MRKPAGKEAMRDAAEKFEEFREKQRVESLGRSKESVYLVSLKHGATYPNAVKVDDIPKHLRTNEEFYNLMRRVVTGEK